jgi:hypothetical protein
VNAKVRQESIFFFFYFLATCTIAKVGGPLEMTLATRTITSRMPPTCLLPFHALPLLDDLHCMSKKKDKVDPFPS